MMLERAVSFGHIAKTAIRRLVKQRIAAMSSDEQRRESAAVCRLVLQHEAVKRARRVALYAAMDGREVDLSEAAAALVRQGKEVLLPRIRSDDSMDFARAQQMGRHAMGFEQPDERGESVEPDVVVCPGRAFDREGHRVGWGKGYYDKALAALGKDVAVLGVCFRCQLFDEVPHDPHDHPMRAVLHE
jgi:5-formyltetrahydrofolate cyclo-ligase